MTGLAAHARLPARQAWTDRVCLVTGSASGIGAAVARALATAGARVAGLDLAPAPDTVVRTWPCDVRDPVSVERAVGEILERHGRVDVLVNSAGIHRPGTVVDTSIEDWEAIMAANVRGPFLVSRAVVPAMSEHGGGSIVHIGSVAGSIGGRGSAAYIASKGALIALARAMAADHAGQRIRVDCVCPGMVETPMLERTQGGLSPDEVERLRADRAALHPLGRLGTPSDIVPAVLFLASPDPAWITGSVLTIDGGYAVR